MKIKTKINPKQLPCRWCGKKTGIRKFYIIADDLESPKPYHVACIRKLQIEVMMKLSDSKMQINNDKPKRKGIQSRRSKRSLR
jgi:hypothetical protein